MKKLSLKAKMYLVIAAIALVGASIFAIINFNTKDADRFNYSLNEDGITYTITDIKNNFRGGIFGKDTITVPSTYKGKKVTTLKQLQSQTIKKVIIEDGIEYIGGACFYEDIALEEVTLPNTLKEIGSSAFFSCNALTSINLPDSCEYLADSCFKSCVNLTSINTEDVLSFGSSCFENTKITTISLNNAITTIPASFAKGCSELNSVAFTTKLTSIGASAFEGCAKITSFDLSNNYIIKIGTGAFKGTGLTTLSLKNKVTETIDNAKDITGLDNKAYKADMFEITGTIVKEGTTYYFSNDGTDKTLKFDTKGGKPSVGDNKTYIGYVYNNGGVANFVIVDIPTNYYSNDFSK